MTLPKEIKCVIFDMDGVIIDSEEIHKKAYYETFISIGVDVSDDLYKTLTGSSTINAFQRLVTHFNLDLNPKELVLNKRKRYVNFFENDPTLHLVNGVEELIKYCYNKGAKISGADLTASKPHPEIFEKAAVLGNTPKKNCIVIEDSDNGIKAANDAGIYVVGYRNKMADDQTLENADFVIDDFSLLKEII